MLRVMIVDDEPKICSLILHLGDWERLGLKVVAVCHDGEEALEKIKVLEPHIVITDIRMPILDGLELIPRARELGQEISFIIISGYRNFEYAYNALQSGVVNYLLKPIDQQQLNATLEKTIAAIQGRQAAAANEVQLARLHDEKKLQQEIRFIQALAEGQIEPIESFPIHPDEGLYGVCIVNPSFAALHEKNSVFGTMVVECAEKLFKPFGDLLAAPCWNGIVIIPHFDADRRSEVEIGISTLFGEVRSLADVFGDFNLSFGCSQPVQGSCLARAYAEAVHNEHRKLKLGWNQIITTEDTGTKSAQTPAAIRANCQGLFSAAEILNVEMIKAWFQAFLENAQIDGEPDIDFLFESRAQLLQQYAQKADKAAVERLRLQTELTASVEEFVSLLSDAFVGFVEGQLERIRTTDARPIWQAKEYIHQNYAKNLSLDMVAESVGYSSVYFSSMFKKSTGESFMDYVIQVRIDKAKELLKTTGLSITDIASQIGYQDDKYFRKLFHKIVGITPKAYRRLYE